MPTLSLIIPVYHESLSFLDRIKELLSHHGFGEIIVVFTESDNALSTVELKKSLSVLADNHKKLIIMTSAEKGRAHQMNYGAKNAKFRILMFLHADTYFDNDAIHREVEKATLNGFRWGRFNVKLIAEGSIAHWEKFCFFTIATLINLRSKLSKIATGDQAIFIETTLFQDINGFDNIPLMEDIALCKTLKQKSIAPFCTHQSVSTSARRWQKHGIIKTIFLMWRLRFLYWRGVSPEILAKEYRDN